MNIFSKCSCDHGVFAPCASITAMSARDGITPLSMARSSLRETGSSVCLGQEVTAPIKDCSASKADRSGRFSTKLRAAAQPPRRRQERKRPAFVPHGSAQIQCALLPATDLCHRLSMAETTKAALDSTRSRSCGSGWGSATAILTVSTTNFCWAVSFTGGACCSFSCSGGFWSAGVGGSWGCLGFAACGCCWARADAKASVRSLRGQRFSWCFREFPHYKILRYLNH